MFVAAYDDRVLAPGYFLPFIRNTIKYCDLNLISPAINIQKSISSKSRFKVCIQSPRQLKGYQHSKTLFDGLFVNYSTNPASFERACFHRWFALNAATSALGDSSFICLLDTDCLIGMSPSEILAHSLSFAKRESIDFIAEWPGDNPVAIGPEITIMTKSYLFNFCKFLLTTYFSQGMKSLLYGEYFDRIGNGLSGGVCDMRALAFFSKEFSKNSFNLRNLENPCIIPNFNSFLADHGRKSENWKISIRSSTQTLHLPNQTTSIIGIHFQGGSKALMNVAARETAQLTSKFCTDYIAQPRFIGRNVSKIQGLINRLVKIICR